MRRDHELDVSAAKYTERQLMVILSFVVPASFGLGFLVAMLAVGRWTFPW